MTSIVTDYLPLEIKSKPYYVHAKRGYLSHLLLDAAKAGQDVYENEYNNSISCLAKLLVSKEKVQKVLPMFNHDTVESFVSRFKEIEENISDRIYRDYRYSSCFESAPLMGSFIKSDEIATVR